MTVPVVRFTVAGLDEPTAGLGRAYTVVFDGDCRVCTRLSGVLRSWDSTNQLEIVSSQQPGVMARLEHLLLALEARMSHLNSAAETHLPEPVHN